MADKSEPLWQMAFEEAKTQFEIENFLAEQKEAIKAFFQNKNVFVNLPTGFGKSIIYQCLTIVGDVLHKKPRGSSVIVVIFPLRSLMNDQVQYLHSVGIPAIAIPKLFNKLSTVSTMLFMVLPNVCYLCQYGEEYFSARALKRC